MNTRMRWMLKCSAPDGDGGGGAGDDDKPLSRREVTDLINKTVTGATKNWGERFAKDITGTVTKLVGESTSPIMAKLEELAAAGQKPNGQGQGGQQGGGMSDETKQALAKAESQAKQAAEDVKKMQQALQAKDVELATRTLRGGITEALQRGGVRKELMDAALLVHQNSGAVYLKDGAPVFKVKRDGFEEELPVEDGIKEWLKTDTGKVYLPPVDAGGTGDTRTPRGGVGNMGAGAGLFSKDQHEREASAISIIAGG